MSEKIIQRASLIGHVVEDLIYQNINPARFRAELARGEASKTAELAMPPEYKQEGFFVFSNLGIGEYTLEIRGERFQPAIRKIVIPDQSPVFLNSFGDNELIVIIRKIEDLNGNGGKKISFDPVILTTEIRAGAQVISEGLPAGSTATLLVTLEAGRVSEARVETSVVPAVGSIARFIRDRSIRMNFDPYYLFESPITRVVGKVVSKMNPEIPLAGAQVRVSKINETEIESNDVGGVEIFTGEDVSGEAIVLGVEKDISAVTNEKGDYNLYFSNETLASVKITDETLDELEAAGVPEGVRDKLETLKDGVFRGKERFLVALRETIDNGSLVKYRDLILLHSENFIRDMTLKATLEGFKPKSEDKDINSAERNVVDFQLVKM
jgi:hypothetical protein